MQKREENTYIYKWENTDIIPLLSLLWFQCPTNPAMFGFNKLVRETLSWTHRVGGKHTDLYKK